MRRSTHSVRSLLTVIAFFVTTLAVSSGTASAASSYDDLIEPVSNVFVGHNGPCEGPFDLTANWPSYVTNDQLDYGGGSTARSNFRASLATALSTGTGWAVSQTRYGDAGHVNVFVHADGYPTSVTSFYTISGYQLVLMSNVYGLQISYSSFGPGDCRVYMDYNTSEAANSREIAFDQQGIYTRQPLFANTPITYPAGYEGKLFPTEPPAAKYVAMGDSFSSGEGNPPFEIGTDENDVNECHRSMSAYPHWLSQTPSLNLERISFVACSGATTTNILYGGASVGAWNEPPQVDALSEDTKVVTLTIGGNDVGFGDFATACVAPSSECGSNTMIYATTMYKIQNTLPGSLEDILTKIAERTSDAKVYVIGYPYITPSSDLSSLPVQCSYLNSSAGDGADSLAARDVVTELNDEIDNTVTRFTNTLSTTEFTYIDPNMSVDGSFDGHDLCQGPDAYFYNVAPNDILGNGYRQKIFHPNIDGQYEYYKIVNGVIGQN